MGMHRASRQEVHDPTRELSSFAKCGYNFPGPLGEIHRLTYMGVLAECLAHGIGSVNTYQMSQ